MKPGDIMQTCGTRFLAPGTMVTLLAGREAPYGDKWLVSVHGRVGLDARWYVKESCLKALAATRRPA